MPSLTDELAQIDVQIAGLEDAKTGTSPVEAAGQQLDTYRGFTSSTTKDLGDFNKGVDGLIERIETDPNATDVINSDKVSQALDSIRNSGTTLGDKLDGAMEYVEGVQSDFEGVGEFTPESFKGELEEFSGSITDLANELLESVKIDTGALKELLEHEGFRSALEQVQGGVDKAGEAVGDVDKGLEAVEKILDTLENLEDVAGGDPQAQLEALGELFGTLTEQFGGAITSIPGLGAFFTLYGKAFEGAAKSAGAIDRIADRNNALYQIDRSGKYLYLTDDALDALRLQQLYARRDQIVRQLTDDAQAEYAAKTSTDTGPTELDIVIGGAIRAAEDSRPELMSPAYVEWKDASEELEEASEALSRARGNLDAAKEDLEQAKLEASRPDGTRDRSADPVGEAERALARAQQTYDSAKENHAGARSRYDEANAAHRAESDAYNDAIRDEIIKRSEYANKGQGFTEQDWQTLGVLYPMWEVTPEDLAPPNSETSTSDEESEAKFDEMAAASAAAASQFDSNDDDDYDLEEFDTGTEEPPAVAAAQAGGANRKVMMGVGGGIFAICAVALVFVLPNLGGTPTTDTIQSNVAVQSQDNSESEEPADTGDSADEPTDESTAEASNGPATVDDICSTPLGCVDYGMLPDASGMTVAWTPISNCDAPLDGSDEVRFDAGPIGTRIYFPGNGSCYAGGGEVICGGYQQRGQVESGGEITLLGETFLVTEVGDTGMTGIVQEWEAPPLDDGSADLNNLHCRSGSQFVVTAGQEAWAAALNAPIHEEPPIKAGAFSCVIEPNGDAFDMTYAFVAQAPPSTTDSPFTVDIHARFGGWVTVPANILGVLGDDGTPFVPVGNVVNTLDEDGNPVTVSGEVYTEMLRQRLAERIRQELGDDTDADALIDELGLDIWDIPGSLETLGISNAVVVVGRNTFDPADGEEVADALSGFDASNGADAQPSIGNGAVFTFAPSEVCGCPSCG